MTKEDHETPSNAELIADDPDDPYEEQGQSIRHLENQKNKRLTVSEKKRIVLVL